jgi:hypothetical protein
LEFIFTTKSRGAGASRDRAAFAAAALVASACGGGAGPADSPDSDGAPAATPAQEAPVDSSDAAETREPSATAQAKIAQLEDPETRAKTLEGLIAEYKESAKHGSEKPEAKAFIEDYAAAMAEAYAAGHDSLDEKLRLELMTMLHSFKDARTVPAHAKALEVYAETQAGADEAIWACQAAQYLGDERLSAPLMKVFVNIDRLDNAGRRLGNHVAKAMRMHPNKAWAPQLEELLSAPLERPASFDDKPGVKKFQNQQYWQLTAAELLGPTGGKSSARVLALALLDPSKLDVHPAAEVSLAQLKRYAAPLAHGLLDGSDSELVAAAKKARPDMPQAPVVFATKWLANFGASSSADRLEAAWDANKDALSRVLIARALTHYPRSERAPQIFKDSFLQASLKLTLPGGESALEALVVESPYLFEPKIADWLMDRPGKIRGKGRRKGDLQQAIVATLGQIVTVEQVKAADTVSQKYGGRSGTPAFDASKALVSKCKADAKCYVETFVAKANGSGVDTDIAIKALVMTALYGGKSERQVIISKLNDMTDPALIVAATRVIHRMTEPRDSAVVAAALGKVVEARREARAEQGDPDDRIGLPIAFLWYRLSA